MVVLLALILLTAYVTDQHKGKGKMSLKILTTTNRLEMIQIQSPYGFVRDKKGCQSRWETAKDLRLRWTVHLPKTQKL